MSNNKLQLHLLKLWYKKYQMNTEGLSEKLVDNLIDSENFEIQEDKLIVTKNIN